MNKGQNPLIAFVKGQEALLIDGIARRYCKRPSELVGLVDPWLALDFDLGIAKRAIDNEEKQMRNEKAISKFTGAVEGMAAMKNLVNKSRRIKGLTPWR